MNASRIFDRVHREVQLSEVAAAYANDPFFFRLDGIRQLGGCAFVFPSATHTRREHALGVAHLARRAAEHLRALYPDRLDAADVTCVEVAGLLHDLGHGPFSHMFEEYIQERHPEWSHEGMTIRIVEHIWKGTPGDLALVKTLILGLDDAAPWPAATGRPESKRFLVDLVHDQRAGIDVDKLDYLSRDALSVFGETQAVDTERILGAMRLVECEGRERVGFESNVAFSLERVYAQRTRLHRQLYQHRAVLVVEGLLKDLMRAHEAGGTRYACDDLEAYLHLTDATILHRAHRGIAAEVWQRVMQRPWKIRIPGGVVLRTLPACRACYAVVAPADRYCRECGVSLVAHAVHAPGSSDLWTTEEAAMDDKQATAQMIQLSGCADVRVYISDVACGTATTATDAQGRVWLDYDPMARVVLCDRNGDVVTRPSAPTAPVVRRVRVAHCYVDDPQHVETASRAFAQWGLCVGM